MWKLIFFSSTLFLILLSIFVLFVCTSVQKVTTVLAYDRSFLLNLLWTVEAVSDSNHGGYKIPDPPFLSMLPSESII